MTFARSYHLSDLDMLPRMPAWVTSARAETLEDVAFLSGAALNHLYLVLGHEEVPQALLRDRLALHAAEACMAFSGRPVRAGELRDTVHLLRSARTGRGNLPRLAARGGAAGVDQGSRPSNADPRAGPDCRVA
jgi:hypothetical protein